MDRPLRARGLAVLIATIAMTDCQKRTYGVDEESTHEHQTLPRSKGISWGEKSFIGICGNTHSLCFRYHSQDQGDSQHTITVHLDRINPANQPIKLDFPPSIRLHEHQFREGNVSYFLATGYVASTKVFFHRMRCDQPGSLHARATLSPGGKADSRSLFTNVPHASRVWMLPFEAEVVRDQNSLLIEGEGELLLLWHLPGHQHAAESWQNLLRQYDPASDAQEIDLSVVADALQEAARRQN
jgi:hypothetical protein